MALAFDIGIIGLFITLAFYTLALWRNDEKEYFMCALLHLLTVGVSLATGIYYMNSNTFSLNWWVGISLILFAVFNSFCGLYYGSKHATEK